MNKIFGAFGVLFGIIVSILFFILGSIQWLAGADGIAHWMHIPGFLAAFISAFLAYIPVIGTIVGVLGAVNSWGWEWYWAVALFVGPWATIALISLIAAALSVAQEMIYRRRQSKVANHIANEI